MKHCYQFLIICQGNQRHSEVVLKPAEYLHHEEIMCPLPRPDPLIGETGFPGRSKRTVEISDRGVTEGGHPVLPTEAGPGITGPRGGTLVYGYIYDISVSNNGLVFSNSLSILSYQRACLICSRRRCQIKVSAL